MGKSFKSTVAPAMQAVTQANADRAESVLVPDEEVVIEQPKTGRKRKGAEVRSRRVQLVLEPAMYEQISDIAWRNRESLNQTIITAIREYTERENRK